MGEAARKMEPPAVLPRVYSEAEAAEMLTRMGYPISTESLRKYRRQGKIGFRRVGPRRPVYTMKHLTDFLEGDEACPANDQKGDSKSGRSGSGRSTEAQNGTHSGTMEGVDELAAEAWGQRI